MKEWETIQLYHACKLVAGYAFKSKDFGDYPDKVIKITHIVPPTVDMKNLTGVDLSQYERKKLIKYIAKQGDYVLAMTGATIGKMGRIEESEAYVNQRVLLFKNNPNVDKDYLFYVLQQNKFQQYILNHIDSESAQPNISAATVGKYEFLLPSLKIQNKIGKFLRLIDDKINVNNRINDNLEQQVLALYNERFVSTINRGRRTCRVDEFFDISIGKTPPRKEPQWFSINLEDITWVSISDMASCGLYISSSSEQLTAEAVEKHNVKIVPDNTVLLSFKLTVGRIAITDGEMTTNEAIAHFKTNNKVINEYLYCYLRLFNYQTMGSTSSIATAVNSKIIKAMPFVIPTNEELTEFHSLAAPMFALIKSNQREIERLSSLRDTFLPKLMSGEIDVSNIQL